MTTGLVQTLGQLPGVLVGGGITGLIGWFTHRRQRTDTVDAEHRAREWAATARIAETAAKLMPFDGPYADQVEDLGETERRARWAEWRRSRAELILTLQVAALDISDEMLRAHLYGTARLMQAHSFFDGGTDDDMEEESRVRHTSCEYVIKAIGEYRRAEDVEEPSGWLASKLGPVVLTQTLDDSRKDVP